MQRAWTLKTTIYCVESWLTLALGKPQYGNIMVIISNGSFMPHFLVLFKLTISSFSNCTSLVFFFKLFFIISLILSAFIYHLFFFFFCNFNCSPHYPFVHLTFIFFFIFWPYCYMSKKSLPNLYSNLPYKWVKTSWKDSRWRP